MAAHGLHAEPSQVVERLSQKIRTEMSRVAELDPLRAGFAAELIGARTSTCGRPADAEGDEIGMPMLVPGEDAFVDTKREFIARADGEIREVAPHRHNAQGVAGVEQ